MHQTHSRGARRITYFVRVIRFVRVSACPCHHFVHGWRFIKYNTFVLKGHGSNNQPIMEMLACQDRNLSINISCQVHSREGKRESWYGTCAHLQNWMHSKLKNILLHNWTTFYGIVSISTTCWRKFVQFRFAKFCSILKSIPGDGQFGNKR